MFSSKNQLLKRTPESGTDRESFLSLLVDEYLHSSSFDCKCQVLANLGNFAYDPINYQFIRDVGVLDIFIHILKHESNHQLLHYAVAGICNLSCDPVNGDYILAHCELKPLIALLKIDNNEIVANTITTLNQLKQYRRQDIYSDEVIKLITNLQNSNNRIISNLATIYLQDV